MVPETFEVKGILVDSPEQMVFERGLLMTEGTGVLESLIVSPATQLSGLVMYTA